MKPRFVVLEPAWPAGHRVPDEDGVEIADDGGGPDFVGYDGYGQHGHVTRFKTIRNAKRAAMMAEKLHARVGNERGVSRIFLLDYRYLPELLPDDFAPARQIDDDSELAMAERQLELWCRRVEAIKLRLASGKT